MKKLFILVIVALGFAACVQEQVVETPQGGAITFESAFVDNSTRAAVDPSTTTNTLTAFDVWGFVKEHDGIVFVDQDVTLNGGAWGYEGTQFWAPNQPYYFAALAPMNSANLDHVLATGDAAKLGLGTLTFTNENGSEDVLYAFTQVTSKGLNQPNDAVKFQFKHLLSKVKFTFKNGFITNNASVKITNIKMTAPAAASIDVAQADYAKAWVPDNAKVTLAFGDVEQLTYGQEAECAAERLTIPAAATYEYTITFDVELFMGAQSVYTVSKTSTVTGVELEMGKAYNFTAEINPENLDLDIITFDVIEVEDWENAADVPAHVGTTVYVDDAAEFAAAVNNPEVAAVVLNNDIELGSTLTRAGEEETVITKSFVLDGNGKTLTYTGSDRVIDIRSDVENETYKNVTIKDVTINCTGSYIERGINYNANGRLILEGVKFIGTAPTYAVNFPAKADNSVVTINNCELTGRIALNVWGANMCIDVENSVLTSVDNTATENYAAVKLCNDGGTAVANGTVIKIKNSEITATDENGDPSCAFNNASETGEIAADDDCEVVGTTLVQIAALYYKNSDQFYSVYSLSDAITEVVSRKADGIRLTRDFVLEEPVAVPNGTTVLLDLNGKKISATDTNVTGNFYLIDNRGNLTIKDNSAAKTGSITLTAETNRNWNHSSVVVANNPGGKLTLDGGLIEHLGGSDMAYGIDNLTNGKGTYAETVINGGTVKSPYRAVRQFLNGTEAQNILTVNGGVIEGANKSIWMQDPSANANTGKLTVAPTAQLKGDVYLYVCAGSTQWPVEVSIAEAAFVEGTVLTGNVPAGYLVMNKEGNWRVINAAEEGITVVYTAEELNKLNASNAYVVLGADIDFQGAAMTKPIELWGNSTFDGMGHKISNVKTAVQGGYATSLFRGDANPGKKVVKNLVIENLTTPAGYSYASAIWSDLQGANIEIDNVTINNSTIEANGTIGGFVGFVSASTTSVVIKNSSINNSNLNGGEADHKRGAVVGRAYGCTVTCEDVVVDNVKINGVAATTSTLVGDKGYTGTVTVK